MLETAVSQAAGSAVQPVADIGRGLFNSFKRKYNYVRNLDKNHTKMKDELRRLDAKELDVNRIVEMNSVRMERTNQCAIWQEDVLTVKRQVVSLETRYCASKCFCGLCPFRSRLQLSKDIERKTSEIVNLHNRISMDRIVMDRRPAIVEHRHPKKEDIPSLNEYVEKILSHLRDRKIKRIGIWGFTGVGKTTIMEHLNDKVENTGGFDIVLWVKVSKEGSVDKIQKTLLNRLKLRVEDMDTDHATLISKSLESKKYLLLLDEVFSELNLRDIGIHDTHEFGKIVMSTRSRIDCQSMDVDEDINVKSLSRNDAWKLFRDTVGDAADHPRIIHTAKRVLRECGGLPQLIKVVGKTLKNECDSSLWSHKLRILQSPTSSQLRGMEEAFKAFKLVYDELSTERKNCILYGALFPEDHEIYQEYLMECWNSESFILDAFSFRSAGHGILKDLIDRSLLERCEMVEYIKMPTLLRNMALRVMYPDEEGSTFLVKSGEQLTTHPAQEEWSSARRVSLMCNELRSLPDSPDCCTITTLLLQRNASLRMIPESFFGYMCALRVLDLGGTRIKSLPTTVSNLNDLRSLYLNDCTHMVELPIQIAELKNLEILDIRGTGIRSLPSVIRELVGLRCLRVSFATATSNQNPIGEPRMPLIPTDVVTRLSQLEELTIGVDPKEQSWNEIVDDIATEVASLVKLTTLCFYFPKINCFESFIRSRESWKSTGDYPVKSFKFYIGSYEEHHGQGLVNSDDLAEGYLRFSNGEGFPEAISLVLLRVITFELIRHSKVQSLLDFGVDQIKGWKVCRVEECKEMKSIIKVNTTTGPPALPYLEKLDIVNLPKLEYVWEGSLEPGSLSKLTTLTISHCPSLKRLLSGEMIQHLSKLQHLKIEKCPEITELIVVNSQLTNLPDLRYLQLVHLPKLVSICSNANLMWPALEKLEIIGCNNLKILPLTEMNAIRLKRIECTEDWWNASELETDSVKDDLRLFCRFV